MPCKASSPQKRDRLLRKKRGSIRKVRLMAKQAIQFFSQIVHRLFLPKIIKQKQHITKLPVLQALIHSPRHPTGPNKKPPWLSQGGFLFHGAWPVQPTHIRSDPGKAESRKLFSRSRLKDAPLRQRTSGLPVPCLPRDTKTKPPPLLDGGLPMLPLALKAAGGRFIRLLKHGASVCFPRKTG